MAISESLLPEFDQEMAGVRKTLERVPEDKFDWKPHPKSLSMSVLAGHIANLPSWGTLTVNQDELDITCQAHEQVSEASVPAVTAPVALPSRPAANCSPSGVLTAPDGSCRSRFAHRPSSPPIESSPVVPCLSVLSPRPAPACLDERAPPETDVPGTTTSVAEEPMAEASVPAVTAPVAPPSRPADHCSFVSRLPSAPGRPRRSRFAHCSSGRSPSEFRCCRPADPLLEVRPDRTRGS